MYEGNGKITISLVRGGSRLDHMCIRLQDDPSLVQFLEVYVGIEDFMRALAGQGYMDCTFELRGTDLVGMVHEVKQEIIFIKDSEYPRDGALVRAAIEPYEVDGWIGHDRDGQNQHCWVKDREPPEGQRGHWYHIGFHRYVDLEPESPS